MNIYQRRSLFRRREEPNIYRLFLIVILILGGIWLIRSLTSGDIKPLFLPTPTPTRVAASYALEGDALFIAGKLEDSPDAIGAISAYRKAVEIDPNNPEVLAKLARIQTYSSAMLVRTEDIRQRLSEALDSINRAVELAPDSSDAHGIRAFVLNWNANPALITDEREIQRLLTEAEQEAVRALQLDNTNTLALAFYAEVLVDRQKWTQAQQYIEQALQRDPSLMDVHRVHAYVLESLGDYAGAIEAYDRAIAITPNLTFLYLRAGANYRRLGFGSMERDPTQDPTENPLFLQSLEYFAKTAEINEQLGVQDPVPYLSIARTYSQMGQFFIAIRNVQKTIEFQPDNPVFYGELGVLYHKNRNYETGILALKCAVRGCTAEESCDGRGGCGPNDTPAEVKGLPLTSATIYYYDIYASELAALSTPKVNYCPEALEIAQMIEDSEYDNDPNIAADIVVVRNICSFSTGITPQPAAEQPAETGMQETPTAVP